MTKRNKKNLLVALISIFSLTSSFAIDLTFQISPAVTIPTQKYYTPGFAGFAQVDFDLFGFLTLGVEGMFAVEKPTAMQNSMTVVGGGFGVGAYYYPFSRLYLGVGGSAGIYSNTMKVNNDEILFSDLYWRASGEVGFRINPTITITGFGGYTNYMVKGNKPLLSGPFAGISARISLSIGQSGSDGFKVKVLQDTPIFPVFMQVYKENEAGTISIYNQEGAEVTDVHVYFRADKYTSESQECAHLSKINKYGTVEVPLLISFNSEILRFSENGKLSGEVIIEYSLLGTKKVSKENVVIDIYNRNTFSWVDTAGLASFVAPNITEIDEFAKEVAGIARKGYRTGINVNIENSMAIVEALNSVKLSYSEDTISPYVTYHNGDELDSIQYPLQTLNNLSGDYDDMGLLLASCFESISIPTGFLVCDDDFIVLVDLQIKPESAANHFGDTSKLIVDDTSAYFGLSMKNFHKGFIKSFEAAGKIIQQANNGDIYAEYTNTHEAWEIYKSTAYTFGGSGLFKKPGETTIRNLYETALNSYINKEISVVIANARKTGDHNKIGLALVRGGRLAEAKAEFAKSPSISAMNNLANIYITEKNYAAAIDQFNKVLAIDPENETAIKGIKKANSEKGL